MPGTRLLPSGGTLTSSQWEGRHRTALLLLAAHLPALLVLGLHQGLPLPHVLVELGGLGLLLVVGTATGLSRRVRACATSVGLVGTSAVLVHVTHGMTESHIHFLLVLAVVAFYEEWVVLGLAVVVSLAHHAGLSLLAPEALFSATAAQGEPFRFAGVHVAAVTAQCLLALRHWRVSERAVADAAAAAADLTAREAEVREHELAVAAQRELQAAHEALLVSEGTLRDVLEAAGDAYLSADAAGLAVSFNPAAEALLGWTAEEVEGQLLTRLLLDDEARDAFLPHRDAYLSTGTGGTHELRLRHRDGHLVDVEATFWRAGSAASGWTLHALARDIRPRKEQAAQLAAARDAALAASRAKSVFLANTSHEIRTPLNGVLGMTALMLGDELTDAQRARAELVQRSGQGLLEVIEDVLDLSRIEAGRLDPQQAAFDLRELAEEALAPLHAAASAAGLELGLQLSDDLPSTVLGDRGRLRQVLVNLLANAVKFTAEGSVALHVSAHEGRVRFSVRDTGVGIAPADQERMFEPFAQADTSTTRRHGGTGLGLSISRELVRVLGGELVVDSAPGVGSDFSFDLPLPVVAPPTAVPAPRAEAAPARPLRLLLAEDSVVNQIVAVGLLEALGCQVDVVDDGQQALDRLAQDDRYDALLLDCQMPVLDGYDAVRQVRARELRQGARRLPVIALTASAMTEDRTRCLAAGMDDYFSKPFAPEEVVAVLQELVTA